MTRILPGALVVGLFFAISPSLRADLITYRNGSTTPFVGGTYGGHEDIWLFSNGVGNDPHRNTGGDGRFAVGGVGGFAPEHERHGLMRWDLSSMLGQFATINSVTLRLYWFATPTGSDTIQVFPFALANSSWVEGINGTGSPPLPGESSYDWRNTSSTPWAGSRGASTPGVDYINTTVGSNTFNTSQVVDTLYDISLTPSIITAWMTGGPNPGLFFRTIGEDEQALFYSSEWATIGLRPELIIDYTPAAVPEPSSLVLLSLVAGAGIVVAARRRMARRVLVATN